MKAKLNVTPRVYSQAQVTQLLGVSPSQVCNYLDAGALKPWFAPALKPGTKRRRMVTAESVEALLDAGKPKPVKGMAQIGAYTMTYSGDRKARA